MVAMVINHLLTGVILQEAATTPETNSELDVALVPEHRPLIHPERHESSSNCFDFQGLAVSFREGKAG